MKPYCLLNNPILFLFFIVFFPDFELNIHFILNRVFFVLPVLKGIREEIKKKQQQNNKNRDVFF